MIRTPRWPASSLSEHAVSMWVRPGRTLVVLADPEGNEFCILSSDLLLLI